MRRREGQEQDRGTHPRHHMGNRMPSQAHRRYREDTQAWATGYRRGGLERRAREVDRHGQAKGKHGAREEPEGIEGQEVAGTRPVEEDGQPAAREEGMKFRDMDPPKGGSGSAVAAAGTWDTGAPTDADVAAGQQGAGVASQCEAPEEWSGSEEDGFCAGDWNGGGVQRRKREKRRVQRLREHRGGRDSSGCDAPMEGRHTVRVCRHPGGAKGEGPVLHGKPTTRRGGATHVVWRSGSAPGRCYDTMAPGFGKTTRRAAVSAGVHTSGVERQHNGAKAGQTSLGGGMPATWRPRRVRRSCRRAQEGQAL